MDGDRDHTAHRYDIAHVHECNVDGRDKLVRLQFQDGPVQENGVNGITNEALIAVLLHRINVLNQKFFCKENERALVHLEDALNALEARTARRVLRGVEGTDTL
jgi:hypothetical protein